MKPSHSPLGAVRPLAAAVLVLTTACATSSQVKPATGAGHASTTPPPSPRAQEEGVRERFAEALAAFDSGNLTAAEEGFREVLERAPRDVNAQFNLGLIAERQGRLADAQVAYERGRAIAPGHVPTLLNLGRLYRRQGRLDEAVALYEGGLEVPGREHEPTLLNNLSVAYRLAGKPKLAEATARRVLARSPDNAQAYKNLALIYYDQGRYRLAELVNANARKLDEKDPGLHNNLGMIYLKLNDHPRALAQFREAVSLDERFAPGYLNIGAMSLTYRDYTSAENAFTRAVELEPTSHEAWLYLAYALEGQKGRAPRKGIAAGETFEKVLALRAELPEALCGAGWAYAAERGGWDKAVAFLQRCKALSTTSPQERQAIDGKLQSIEAMRKNGQPHPEAAPRDEKAAPQPGGESMLDKVSEEAAREEATPPAKAPETAPETEEASGR